MTETRTAAKPARYWGFTRSDRLAHRFRYGELIALCGARRSPGSKLTDDPDLQARPHGTCTRIVHEELGR